MPPKGGKKDAPTKEAPAKTVAAAATTTAAPAKKLAPVRSTKPTRYHVKKSLRRVKGSIGNIHASRKGKIAKLQNPAVRVRRVRSSPRLYMKGTLAGYQRGLHGQNKNVALVRIENVATKGDADFYTGKRVCYVYHGYKQKRCVRWAKAPARRSNTRAIWGRVVRTHGGSGVVRAKFSSPLPGQALGRRIRVYLYPSRI